MPTRASCNQPHLGRADVLALVVLLEQAIGHNGGLPVVGARPHAAGVGANEEALWATAAISSSGGGGGKDSHRAGCHIACVWNTVVHFPVALRHSTCALRRRHPRPRSAGASAGHGRCTYAYWELATLLN